MAAESIDPQTITDTTLNLLGTRLRRLEFITTGMSNDSGIPNTHSDGHESTRSTSAVAARLEGLQKDLDVLRRDNGSVGSVVRGVETLHSKVPELFAPVTSAIQTPRTANLSTLSSTVLAHAPLYPTTASRLSSLQSLPVPDAIKSNQLIELQPRISAAFEQFERLAQEAQALQERSAKCLEWWIKTGVVGMGEVWEDWEWRVNEVEKGVKRAERT